jgi:rod shape-determining protein MreB and related proteins
MMSDFLGVPAKVADDPLTAVARGCGVFLEKLDVFSRVLASDDED